jgi:hypothetical protein
VVGEQELLEYIWSIISALGHYGAKINNFHIS